MKLEGVRRVQRLYSNRSSSPKVRKVRPGGSFLHPRERRRQVLLRTIKEIKETEASGGWKH